jgi:hypothetical protein
MKTLMTLSMNGRVPRIVHVTAVEPPFGSRTNSLMLCATNGLTKATRTVARRGGATFVTSMRPMPARLFPIHS